jgi:hypothetical protein
MLAVLRVAVNVTRVVHRFLSYLICYISLDDRLVLLHFS